MWHVWHVWLLLRVCCVCFDRDCVFVVVAYNETSHAGQPELSTPIPKNVGIAHVLRDGVEFRVKGIRLKV